MKTITNNNLVIASPDNSERGNLHEMASELNQGNRGIDYFDNSNLNSEAPRDDKRGLFSRFILIGLMTLLLSPFAFAQNFDATRMNRDIKIMENILSELFKIEATSNSSSSTSSSAVRLREVSRSGYITASLFGSSSNQVSGNYIPGYGIIFKIPYLLSRNISAVRVIKEGSEPSISFYYDSDDNSDDNQVTEETVVTRITEFFKDYAPTIGQLGDDEQVTIVYGEKKESAPQLRIFNMDGDTQQNEEVEQIPVITVSAKASDLASLRNGSLSSNDFENRLSISKSDGDEKERLDLEVMANILGTAFEDGDEEAFHLINTNSLSYVTINGFGVHYTLDMHRGHGLQSFTFGAMTSFSATSAEEAEESAKRIQEVRKERETTIKAEYQNLIEQMKEYLVDYGRTLNSLSSDQFLIVTANITDHQDIVPAQVNFQLRKSTLEQLDRGQISRDDAMEAVTITEY